MTHTLPSQNFILEELKSTSVIPNQLKLAKKIKKKQQGCYCRKIKNKKIYKIVSPDESSNDEWEQEDYFNKNADEKRQNKDITDLKCVAWNLELFIQNAKQQLAFLEGTMQSNHS